MKLLALLGYPRQNGHTARMTELFLKGAATAGAEIRRADLASLDVRPCLGCYDCWTETPGRCIQQDDMADLLEQFLVADLVLIASPVYSYAVSSYVKHFLERTLTLMSPGTEIGPGGIEHNKWRYPGRGPKRMAAILVAALKSPAILRPSVETLELYATAMRMECSGILTRPESCALRFPQARPFAMKAILTAFERAGAEFVRSPRIPEDLLAGAATPLLEDLPHLVRYSEVFWEHAVEIHDECEAVGEAAGKDVRILIYEMARTANPAAIRGVKASIQLEFPDKNLVYSLFIRDGQVRVQESASPDADLSIRCPSALWVAVKQRTLPGAQLMSHPEVKLEGDLSLFRNLARYFPPPTG